MAMTVGHCPVAEVFRYLLVGSERGLLGGPAHPALR
jgi:hypothetical protein